MDYAFWEELIRKAAISPAFWTESAKIAVPAALVIAGWNVVSKGNDRRETRKEIRQFIDRTIASVENIRKNSIDYLVQDHCDEAKKLELSIGPELMRLESALSMLELKSGEELITAQKLRQIITNNGHYQVAGRVKMDMDHHVLASINMETAELVGLLEKAYRDTYQK